MFDLGGVLCRYVPKRRLEPFAQAVGMTPPELDALLFESGFSARCDAGDYSLGAMCDEVRRRLHTSLDDMAIARQWALAFEPDREVIALAHRIARTHRVGVFTNNGPALRLVLGELLGELDPFDPIVFSCTLGKTKPDVGAFVAAAAVAGSSELLLIDDSIANCEGAERAGWRAVRFDGIGGVLARFGFGGEPEPRR